jgi:hypothetical protein
MSARLETFAAWNAWASLASVSASSNRWGDQPARFATAINLRLSGLNGETSPNQWDNPSWSNSTWYCWRGSKTGCTCRPVSMSRQPYSSLYSNRCLSPCR